MQKVTPASFPDRMLGAEKDGRDNVDSEPEALRHPDPITVWASLLTHKPLAIALDHKKTCRKRQAG